MSMLHHEPIAKAEMLIRRPVDEVFEAFVDPEMTSKFWFTKGSGRLEAGKQVQWDWEMYGASAPVDVIEVEPIGIRNVRYDHELGVSRRCG